MSWSTLLAKASCETRLLALVGHQLVNVLQAEHPHPQHWDKALEAAGAPPAWQTPAHRLFRTRGGGGERDLTPDEAARR